jgi:flagellar hook-associated protein 1 FlgK
MSILTSFSIAAQAMAAQQKAIQTTSHNLANVATPGYSRQRLDLTSAYPIVQGQLTLGNGVSIDGVSSVMNRFSEAELLGHNGTLGFTQAEARALGGIQEAFPVTGGISEALSDFFAAWSSLSNNPGGQAERTAVIGKANALGDRLRETRSLLTNAQSNLDGELTQVVGQANSLLTQIADYNRQIAAVESGGQPANDLRDQRQVLLQEISRLTGATVLGGGQGEQLTVLAGGLLLVSGDRAATLDAGNLAPSGLHTVEYRSPEGLAFDATALFTKGELGGILAMRDVETPNMIGQLDQLAKTLVDEVNAQHALGFDLYGAAGGNFFNPIGAVPGAANIVQATAAVAGDPGLIAAAQTAAGAPGDNGNALALTNLQNSAIPALGNKTLQDYYLSLVQDVGAKAESAQNNLNFQESLLSQAQARRDGLSGVSIEEEMTKLILFQRAFEAASVLVRTGDEMYQTVLAMVR